MAVRCRYCYTPAAGRPQMRRRILSNLGLRTRRRLRGDSPAPFPGWVSGYFSPVYPNGWDPGRKVG